MTLGIADEKAGSIPWRASLPWLVGAFIYVLILLFGRNLLGDPDSYWHVVVGQWIIDHRAFPETDTFSFTFAGSPWVAQEWLSQVLMAAAHGLGGWTGVAVLAAAAVALAFGLLTRSLSDDLSPRAVLVLLAGTMVLVVTPHLLARPHVLAWPVMIAWVVGLVRAVDRQKAPSYFLLPVMVVWANLHGSFTLGLLLVGACGLDATVLAEPSERARTALIWLRFAVLAFVAASITPYGPETILATYRVLSLGSALSIIGEWQPPDLSHIGSFEICLLLALGFALWRGFVLRPARIVILLGLIHLALSAARNGEILGLLAPLFVAAPIARQFAGLAAEPAEPQGRSLRLIALSVLALLLPMTVLLANVETFVPRADQSPAGAVAALKAANVGRVFNDYNFGGYLIYAGIPTFIDGRTELYGADFMLRYFRATQLKDMPDFLTLLDEYRIDATLLAPSTPSAALLDRLPGWKRLYADDTAVVHIRLPLRPTLD